ncbi:MAG: SPOR domain-containing protein [Rhodobacteraceae bacterium]|nr:SPOR domain-containing protein [Paracoccaceae bacterium]
MAIERDGDGPPLKRAGGKSSAKGEQAGLPFTEDVFDDEYYNRRGRASDRGSSFGLIVGIVFGAAVAGGVAWYVVTGPASAPSGPPPVIAAAPDPFKVKPKDPGGMDVPDQDKLVYDRLAPGDAPKRVENLLPAPEKPVPPPVAKPAPAKPAPAVVAEKPSPAPATAPGGESPAGESSKDELAAIVDSMRQQMAAQEAAGVTDMAAANVSDTAKVPATPAAVKDPTPVPVNEPAAEVSQQQAAVIPTAPEPSANPAPSESFLVQLAAARSEEAAQAEWGRLSAKHKDLLAGFQPSVERADLGERGVFFRLRAGPLADREKADALCASLKALNEACLIVRP